PAPAVRIGRAVRHIATGAGRPGGARGADAGARRVAADALGAEPRRALGADAAGPAVGLQTARAIGAHGGRGAVRVGRAGALADVGPAREREAGVGRRRDASAEPVARRGGREQGAGGRAGGGLARRPLHVLLTGAGPVALGVGPAGHGTLVDA